MLTDVQCRNAKPRDKSYKLSDGFGMYLEVMPNGSRYWRLKYRFNKTEKRLSLGVYPEVSLSEAREARDKARKVLATGKDPSVAKRQEKYQAQLKAENCFEAVARQWHKSQSAKWNPEHADRVLTSLEKDVFPTLGKLPVSEITPPEILRVIKKVEQRGALETASRILQRCNSVMQYAVIHCLLDRNPAANLSKALQTREQEHYKHLAADELGEFLQKLAANTGNLHVQTVLALRLMVLTFVRTTELSQSIWEEIDFDKKEWRIPAHRMKMKIPHVVPLSKQALLILEQLKNLNGDSGYIFQHANTNRKPMSNNTMLYGMYRMGYHGRATVHGFRGTASTILNEQGFRPDVIEKQLAHREPNDVRAAYNHAEYMQERREMMQHWADYTERLEKKGAENKLKIAA